MDATKSADCTSIIKAFEKHMLSAPEEGAIVGSTLPRIAAINVNATSAASNLQNLVDPPVPSEVLGSFSNRASTGEDPSVSIPGVQKSTPDIDNWKDWLADCIPCNLRIEFKAELFNSLDDDFLAILTNMVDQYLKEMSFILNLLNASDVYRDVCPLLFAMQDICIPDLQRIVSLLAGILFRMTVREFQGIDIIALLIQPILQPLFVGIFGILNQYKALIVTPLNCVKTSVNAQLGKLQLGQAVPVGLAADMAAKTQALSFGTINNSNRDKVRDALVVARQPLDSLDVGIDAMQNSVGMAASHLDRMMAIGITEIDAMLSDLKSEISGFLGVNDKDTVQFLLNQYQKLIIFRLIEFIAALIKALTIGFNCDFSNVTKAKDTVSTFLNDFLGPNIPVVISTDESGDIQLFFTPQSQETAEGLGSDVTPSQDPEVESTFDAIITQSSQPVTIKPQCVFEPSSEDANKLAQWIAELNATGV